MTNKEIKDAAKENINAGKSKQETFDILRGSSGVPDKTLATLIRPIITPHAREKYKTLNRILVLLLILLGLLNAVNMIVLVKMEGTIGFLNIISIILIVLIIVGVIKYWQGFHFLAGFLSLLGLFRSATTLLTLINEGVSYPLLYVSMFILALIVIVGYGLVIKLTPKFSTVISYAKDTNGQEQKITTIKFTD